jgi:hypothetical protein
MVDLSLFVGDALGVQAMIESVAEAYRSIDEALRDFSWGRNGAFRLNMYGVEKFIAGFAGSRYCNVSRPLQ